MRSTVVLTVLSLAASVVPVQASTSVDAIAKSRAGSPSAWTRVAAGKHNGSGITLAYRVPAGLAPGQSAVVELQLSGVSADDARVEWRGPPGSRLTSPGTSDSNSLGLKRGQTSVVRLDLVPSADGMAYLDVFTTQAGRTTAHSIPLKVGSGIVRLKREGTLQTTPSGEKVISLPSQPR